MPFLVILGEGTWRPDREHFYKAGVHEVSDEIAALARAENLVVTETRPEIEKTGEGPLTMSDLKKGSKPGVQLVIEKREDEPIAIEVPRDHHCIYCEDESFPSAGALERHLEVHHQ